MKALVDGDIVVFRCGMAAERNVWHLQVGEYKGIFEYKREAIEKLDELLPGKYSRSEGEDYMLWAEVDLQPLSHALQNVKTFFEMLRRELQVNDFDIRVAFSDPGYTFRHELAKTKVYKGNRDKTHRPTYETQIRDYIKANYDSYTGEREEADDLLGRWQTELGPEETVICTIDKDLDQIPGYKYNWVHNVTYFVDEEQANMFLHTQILTGDTVDNIPGLRGIGPKKAAKILHECHTLEEMGDAVARAYEHYHDGEDWEEYLNEQANLIFIRRFDKDKWEVPETIDLDWNVGDLEVQ